MRNVNISHDFSRQYPPVLVGMLIAVSVASASPVYAERHRLVASEKGSTTPWYKPAVECEVQYISLLDMVSELKNGGFPVASIAQFVGVERKTVYSWLDGSAIPNPDRENRVAPVYPILKERFDGNFFLMYRVLRAKDRHGSSLESLLINTHIDVEAVKKQLSVLETAINTIRTTDERKKAKHFNTITQRNGAIDDSSVAVFEDI